MQTATVLVVDDDADSRALLELALSFEGYAVVSAPDGRAALKSAKRHHPAVILLDLAMPVMDGFGFRAAQLRDPSIAVIPVICVSVVRRSNVATLFISPVSRRPPLRVLRSRDRCGRAHRR